MLTIDNADIRIVAPTTDPGEQGLPGPDGPESYPGLPGRGIYAGKLLISCVCSTEGGKGGQGVEGGIGGTGDPGFRSPEFVLIVAELRGNLTIVSEGGRGGPGGKGGTGGKGGDGGKAGQNLTPDCLTKPGYCSSPASGGRGGNGATGGRGGVGGRAGDGGNIYVYYGVHTGGVFAGASYAGSPGSGGEGGDPGTLGKGGLNEKKRPTDPDTYASNGVDGGTGGPGNGGESGTNGNILYESYYGS